MKNILISAIALITLGMAATEADAQFYVVKDGKVIAHSDADGDLLDYISFEKPSFTVTFVSGEDATAVEPQDVQYNATVDEPTDPQRDGYYFKGWYNGEEPFDFSAPINGDVKLTAKWLPFPEAVDLGLPSGTKWASFNIGATAPEEYGDYFAWGETEPHYADGHSLDDYCEDWRKDYNGYNWANYKLLKEGGSTWKDIDRYTVADGQTDGTNWYNDGTFVGDNKKELDAVDDAATQILGSDWQMPTEADWQELIDNCTWDWQKPGNTTFGGVAGYKVTSKKEGYTGKYIFLPAAGYRYNADLYYAGSFGDYWSRSLGAYSDGACGLDFNSDYVDANDYFSGRYYGQSVRAVQRKN